jgi:hypothetical protein
MDVCVCMCVCVGGGEGGECRGDENRVKTQGPAHTSQSRLLIESPMESPTDLLERGNADLPTNIPPQQKNTHHGQHKKISAQRVKGEFQSEFPIE